MSGSKPLQEGDAVLRRTDPAHTAPMTIIDVFQGRAHCLWIDEKAKLRAKRIPLEDLVLVPRPNGVGAGGSG